MYINIMPQFDIFIWFSLSCWTILSFQILYYTLLYFVLAPFASIQKTLIKLHILKSTAVAPGNSSSIIECFTLNYFKF